jgi:hypothetical protein
MLTTIATFAIIVFAYWRGIKYGRGRGRAEAIIAIQKPAIEFIDAFYPFGVPAVPQNELDVMAQVLEPITKL